MQSNDKVLGLAAKGNWEEALCVIQQQPWLVNVKGSDSPFFRPLHLAAQQLHVAAIHSLLGLGADRSVITVDGATPHALASEAESREEMNAEDREEILSILEPTRAMSMSMAIRRAVGDIHPRTAACRSLANTTVPSRLCTPSMETYRKTKNESRGHRYQAAVHDMLTQLECTFEAGTPIRVFPAGPESDSLVDLSRVECKVLACHVVRRFLTSGFSDWCLDSTVAIKGSGSQATLGDLLRSRSRPSGLIGSGDWTQVCAAVDAIPLVDPSTPGAQGEEALGQISTENVWQRFSAAVQLVVDPKDFAAQATSGIAAKLSAWIHLEVSRFNLQLRRRGRELEAVRQGAALPSWFDPPSVSLATILEDHRHKVGSGCSLKWLAIGDWGDLGFHESLTQLADAMNTFAQIDRGAPTTEAPLTAGGGHGGGVTASNQNTRQLTGVLSLGDNFYDDGVESVVDSQWKETWIQPFLDRHAQTTHSLHVPWYGVLGNHDHFGSPQAQLDFTWSRRNPDFLWRMMGCVDISGGGRLPKPCGWYQMQFGLGSSAAPNGVDFFVIDTYAAQSCRRAKSFKSKVKTWLLPALLQSTATWKIVLGHHPCYTNGRGHQTESLCLRHEVYERVSSPSSSSSSSDSSDDEGDNDPEANKKLPGLGLEAVLQQGGVDMYLSGHEHVMQAHQGAGGILHATAGSPVESTYWLGKMDGGKDITDWSNSRDKGFAAIDITREEGGDDEGVTTRLRLRFVSCADGKTILGDFERRKGLHANDWANFQACS